RHGQGHRAGRGRGARRAARQDRRQIGLAPGLMTAPLIDGHGRPIGDVRISVTDRCNFRCQYCMPAEGLPWLERDGVLTFEEIVRLTTLLADMGVHDIRLTGGEPLVRRDFPTLAGMLAEVPGVEDLSVT